MEMHVERQGDMTLVTPPGRFLDISNAPEFKKAVWPLAEIGLRVVLDLHHIQFMDSAGCGVLLVWSRHLAQAGSTLTICGVSRPVRTLFDLVRLDRIVKMAATREELVTTSPLRISDSLPQ